MILAWLIVLVKNLSRVVSIRKIITCFVLRVRRLEPFLPYKYPLVNYFPVGEGPSTTVLIYSEFVMRKRPLKVEGKHLTVWSQNKNLCKVTLTFTNKTGLFHVVKCYCVFRNHKWHDLSQPWLLTERKIKWDRITFIITQVFQHFFQIRNNKSNCDVQ